MTILNIEDPAHAAAASRLAARTDHLADHGGRVRSAAVNPGLVLVGRRRVPRRRNRAEDPQHRIEPAGRPASGGQRPGQRENVIFEGTARIDPDGPTAAAVPAYIDKYRGFIDSYGWTPESFAEDYPHVIRVSPTRARIW